jgi:hypothetical protein
MMIRLNSPIHLDSFQKNRQVQQPASRFGIFNRQGSLKQDVADLQQTVSQLQQTQTALSQELQTLKTGAYQPPMSREDFLAVKAAELQLSPIKNALDARVVRAILNRSNYQDRDFLGLSIPDDKMPYYQMAAEKMGLTFVRASQETKTNPNYYDVVLLTT